MEGIARLTSIQAERITEFAVIIREPITTNSILRINGATSFTLSNAGSSEITLNGQFVIPPKGTFNVAMPANVGANAVFQTDIPIRFGVGDNLLHVVEIFKKGVREHQSENYQR